MAEHKMVSLERKPSERDSGSLVEKATTDKESFFPLSLHISDPEVKKLSANFVTMRMDLTREQPFQKEFLNKYGVKGVPTVIFLNRQGIEEKDLRVRSFVGKSEL